MELRHLKIILLGFVLLGALAATADAASVNSLIIADSTTLNQLSDESGEYLALAGDTNGDGTGSYLNRVDHTKTIKVGSILRGAVNFNTLNGSPVGTGGNDVLQGLFSSKVTAITAIALGGGLSFYTLTFGADPDFAAWLSDVHTGNGQVDSTIADPVAAGTAARFFTHGLPNDTDLTSALAGSPDANVATHTNGAYYWDIGFAAGDSWTATFTATSLVIDDTINSAVTFANANFVLSQLGAGAGPTVIPQALGDFVGSINIRGGSQVNGAGFHAANNLNMSFLVAPLPSAAWAGLAMFGLMGVGVIRRRRRNA